MGVGCDEYGVCYADAHGEPWQCPRYVGPSYAELVEALRLARERLFRASCILADEQLTLTAEAFGDYSNELRALLARIKGDAS